MDNKSNLYNSDLMDHIKNARNYRKISGQHIFAEGLNPLCGDRFEIFLVKQNEHIHDVSYQCECCGISMASASIMTDLIKGKSDNEAKEIIDNEGVYNLGLEPNFQDLFDAVKNDASLEPIFMLDFTGTSNGDQGRDYQVAFTGIRSDDQYGLNGGWSVEVPALKVYTTWDAADYRRLVTFDATAVQDGNVVPYTNFTDADGRAVNRPHVAKYTRMASKLPTQDNNGRSSHSNYMMIRYAEVLMIGAEAANEIGQTGDAELWVNRVMARARAGGISWVNGTPATIAASAVPTDFSGLSQADFRSRILEERRLEFAYEMKRWYDIARRKLGDVAFGSDGLESEVSTESGVGPGPKSWNSARDYLFPIPVDEINRNPNLIQNPGY